MIITAVLLVGDIAYALLGSNDPYRYFTGIGAHIDMSPDDQHILFSYFTNGSEALYESNLQGKDVKQLTNPGAEDHHDAEYAPDGTSILYLSEDSKGKNTLYVADPDGSNPSPVSPKDLHVEEAIYSPTSQNIYYIAMPAENINKAEGESQRGYDLYSVKNGEKSQRLTNNDYFTMHSLSVSPNDDEVYYSVYGDEQEKLMLFSIKTGQEQAAIRTENQPENAYYYQLSPDGSQIVYTAVSDESKDRSPFEYELYLLKRESGEKKQLTKLGLSIESPVFFHASNKVAFLKNTNWPDSPEEYAIQTVNIDTGDLQSIPLDMPSEKTANNGILGEVVHFLVNGLTIALLYILLMAFYTLYQFYFAKKTYLPTIISLGIALILLVSSFISAAVVNPWYGIGLGMIAVATFVCTIIVFVFTFFLKRVGKNA